MPSMDTIEAETSNRIDDHFNGEYTFDSKELKSIFPELESAGDFDLIPIVNRLSREFIANLRQNPSRYSVNSFEYAGRGKNSSRIYGLVVGDEKHNSNLSMAVQKTDVNPMSTSNPYLYSRHYWMTSSLRLRGNAPQVEVMANSIRNLIQQKDLEKLMQETKQELLNIEMNRTDTGFGIEEEFFNLYFKGRIEVPFEVFGDPLF